MLSMKNVWNLQPWGQEMPESQTNPCRLEEKIIIPTLKSKISFNMEIFTITIPASLHSWEG